MGTVDPIDGPNHREAASGPGEAELVDAQHLLRWDDAKPDIEAIERDRPSPGRSAP